MTWATQTADEFIWIISLQTQSWNPSLKQPSCSLLLQYQFCKAVKANYLSSLIYCSSVYHKHIDYKKVEENK